MGLTFVHLADIHFQVRRLVYDLDRDLRNELERDALHMREQLPAPASILVGGDIAFNGAADEYEVAQEWIERLCPMLQTPIENVRCVPGNHDVDRECIRRSRTMRDCYGGLRKVPVERIHNELMDYLQEPRVFYRKLEAYNRFAVRFGCDLSKARPYWEFDYELGDGTVLRIRGLNSTLISDDHDDDGANKLVVGEHQGVLQRADGVEYMILCHHPPQWLRDQDRIEDALDTRSRIQLFGHKHVQKLKPIGDTGLRISAGAVHPDRREPAWKPRYNWLQVAIQPGEAGCILEVTVYPRVWNDDKFEPDYSSCGGQERLVQRIPLAEPVGRGRDGTARPETAMGDQPARDDPIAPTKPISSAASSDPARTLAHRYLSLSYVRRMAIAQALALVADVDEGVPQNELSRSVFRRARERGLLSELWDQVMQEGAWTPRANPFRPGAEREE
jgi:predicted MPP superfamily phosphohydrolase